MRPRGRPQGPCGQALLPPSWSHVLFPRDTHTQVLVGWGRVQGLLAAVVKARPAQPEQQEGRRRHTGGCCLLSLRPRRSDPLAQGTTDLPQCPVVSQTRAQRPPPGLVRTVQGAFRPGPALRPPELHSPGEGTASQQRASQSQHCCRCWRSSDLVG